MYLIIVVLITFLMASCTPAVAPTPTPQPTATPTRIALVMKTLTNPFFVEMERGARRAEQEFGIELIVRTAAQETSIEQQIEIVEELIQEAVDAIVIAPGDSVELIPVLKRAQDAGIIVVNIDNQLDPNFASNNGLDDVPFISVDNEQGAYLAVRELIKDIDEPTGAVILEGIRGAKNAEDRKNGALRAFAENSHITVNAAETANWMIDEAYTTIGRILAQYPNVRIIFCANDMMALGVLRYLEERDRTDMLVGGFDALAEAKDAIRDSTLQVTIDQQAALQGYTGVEYAVKMLRGETVDIEKMVEVLVITPENVDD